MINNVVLVGRLTKKPELRYTQNNIAVCQFVVAVNRPFQSNNGASEADFVSCVTWRTNAENMAKYLDKGALVGIEGRIQTRNYDDPQSGQKRYVTEVVADNVRFLESKNSSSNNNNYQQANLSPKPAQPNPAYGNVPNNGFNQPNPFNAQLENKDQGFNNGFSQNQGTSPFNNNPYEAPLKDETAYVNPFKSSIDIDLDEDKLPF